MSKPKTDEVKAIITKSFLTTKDRNDGLRVCIYCENQFGTNHTNTCKEHICQKLHSSWACTREKGHEGPCVACEARQSYGKGVHLLAIESEDEKFLLVDPIKRTQ